MTITENGYLFSHHEIVEILLIVVMLNNTPIRIALSELLTQPREDVAEIQLPTIYTDAEKQEILAALEMVTPNDLKDRLKMRLNSLFEDGV